MCAFPWVMVVLRHLTFAFMSRLLRGYGNTAGTQSCCFLTAFPAGMAVSCARYRSRRPRAVNKALSSACTHFHERVTGLEGAMAGRSRPGFPHRWPDLSRSAVCPARRCCRSHALYRFRTDVECRRQHAHDVRHIPDLLITENSIAPAQVITDD